jgi:large subunit ribosomal protein LX
MPKEVQVENYRVVLHKKPLKLKTKFEVDIRATNEDDALEKAYSRIGSKHRVPRTLLAVTSIKKISTQEIKNNILREIASNDDIKIQSPSE